MRTWMFSVKYSSWNMICKTNYRRNMTCGWPKRWNVFECVQKNSIFNQENVFGAEITGFSWSILTIALVSRAGWALWESEADVKLRAAAAGWDTDTDGGLLSSVNDNLQRFCWCDRQSGGHMTVNIMTQINTLSILSHSITVSLDFSLFL